MSRKILEDVVSRDAVKPAKAKSTRGTQGAISRRSFLAFTCGAMLLSACGFQLRGQQDYPFKRLAIAGGSPEMLGRLQRMVEGGSDTVIVKASEKPDAILSLSGGTGMKTLSLNAQGVVQEYELDYSLGYSMVGADGTILIPPSTISLNRALTYSDQYTLAKGIEAQTLYRDMQFDAVDQLTRRLAVVRSLHPAPSEALPGIAPRAPLPVPPL
jgi:LPS-assembly lipoprotein